MELAVVDRNKCPICGSAKISHLYDLHDDRFGQPDLYPLDYCSSCDFAYLGKAVAPEDTAKLYSKYYPHEAKETVHNWRQRAGLLARIARWVDGNVNPAYTACSGEIVLDVGCGSGHTLAICRILGANGEGVEVDPLAAAETRKNGFVCHEGLIEGCTNIEPMRYDRILLNQVLEHVLDPVGLLKHLQTFLTDSGTIIVSVPHLNAAQRRLWGKRWFNWHAPYHANHFSRKALQRSADASGLRISRFAFRTPGNWLLIQWNAVRRNRPELGKRFRTSYPLWKRLLVAPIGRMVDIIGMGEGMIACLSNRER